MKCINIILVYSTEYIIVSILLFADDIVLIAEIEQNLQSRLHIIYEWFRKYSLVNKDKTKVFHFIKQGDANARINSSMEILSLKLLTNINIWEQY